MKLATTFAALTIACASLHAQTATTIKPFSKIDGGVTLGTTGVGLEVTTPISRDWDVRAGFDFMPRFTYDMNFGVTVGDDNTSAEISTDRFNKMASTLYDVTGYKVDDKVVMEGQPKMYNFKVLVDFKPLRDKRWHVTAGFYWGNAKIATAENAKEDMTSLFALGLYNRMYEKAYNIEPLINLGDVNVYMPYELEEKLVEYGRMSIHVGTYKRDVTDAEGNVVHKKGDDYNMEPDENSMVSAYAKVNRFKPYLGIGFMGTLTKRDPRWHVGFDAGAMFWGGTPELKTHDGTDLINDVYVTRRKVRHYVKLFKAMKVMPVVNFRITRTL